MSALSRALLFAALTAGSYGFAFAPAAFSAGHRTPRRLFAAFGLGSVLAVILTDLAVALLWRRQYEEPQA